MIIIYHMHGVGIDLITNNLKKQKKSYHEITYLKNNLYQNINDLCKDKDSVKILTLIKDPIVRNFECYTNHNKSLINDLVKKKKFKEISDLFVQKYNHKIPDNWLNNEFLNKLELDKDALKLFNKNTGHLFIQKGKFEILIIRHEDIPTNNKILTEFLELPVFYNKIGFNYRYIKYMKLIKNYLPSKYLEDMLKYDITNIFYDKKKMIIKYKIETKIHDLALINNKEIIPNKITVLPAKLDEIFPNPPSNLSLFKPLDITTRSITVDNPDDYYGNHYDEITDDVAYIFLYRKDCLDRYSNLLFMIKWLKEKMNNIYNVYLVEIDKVPKLDLEEIYQIDPNVKYIFLYCNNSFNRGWGYNCICKNICHEKVVVLADTDLVFDNNILSLIKDVHDEKLYFASPYRFIHKTNPEQKKEIIEKFDILSLKKSLKNYSKNHYTFGGGILIANRKKYLEIGGFEEYNCYGMEDRSIDVMIFNSFDKSKITMDSKLYFHLHHPNIGKAQIAGRILTNQEHLKKHFGCTIGGNNRGNNIHSVCRHKLSKITDSYKELRNLKCGDIGMYYKQQSIPNNGISLKILFFSDINSQLKKYKGPLSSNYCFDPENYIGHYKNTTIIDFIYFMKYSHNYYDAIILDIGFEDFKFREVDELYKDIYGKIEVIKVGGKKIKKSKKEILEEFVPKELLESHIKNYIIKDNKKYNCAYSLNILEKYILPQLTRHKNLIWIDNPNINLMYAKKINKNLKNIIEYSNDNVTEKIYEIVKNNQKIVIIDNLDDLNNYNVESYHLFCIDQNYKKFYDTKFHVDFYLYDNEKSDHQMEYDKVESKVNSKIFIFNSDIKPIDNKLTIIKKLDKPVFDISKSNLDGENDGDEFTYTIDNNSDNNKEIDTEFDPYYRFFSMNHFIDEGGLYENVVKIAKNMGFSEILNINNFK